MEIGTTKHIKGYTYTLSEIKNCIYNNTDDIQFTVNPKQTPLNVYINLLLNLKTDGNVVIHLHPEYTASAYMLYNESVIQQMLSFITTTLFFCDLNFMYEMKHTQGIKNHYTPNIRGIILHTDNPIPEYVLKTLREVEVKTKDDFFYMFRNLEQNPKYTVDEIIYKCINNGNYTDGVKSFMQQYYIDSLDMLYSAIQFHLYNCGFKYKGKGKVYLENTTKLYTKDTLEQPATFKWLNEFTKDYPLFGVCYDEEHSYSTGEDTLFDYEKDTITNLIRILDVDKHVIHLNTIPPAVLRSSFIDSHRKTTINDGKVSNEVFFELIECLNREGFLYYRELNSVSRVIEQIQNKQYVRY